MHSLRKLAQNLNPTFAPKPDLDLSELDKLPDERRRERRTAEQIGQIHAIEER